MSGPAIRIQRANSGDIARLQDIYRSSIIRVGPTGYTDLQVRSWLAFADSPEFVSFIESNHTFVAIADEIVGFGGLWK